MLENAKILALSGKFGSGKTTLSEYIYKYLSKDNLNIYKIKFAQPLYDIKSLVFNYFKSISINESILNKIDNDKVLLQLLGTEWGRNTIDNDIWVKSLLSKINNIASKWPYDKMLFIIDDLRFKNEFEALKNVGAFTVRLKRIDSTPEELIRNRDANHLSETDLDDYEDSFDLIEYTSGNHTIEESCAFILESMLKHKK